MSELDIVTIMRGTIWGTRGAQAADEIERLRKELQEAKDWRDHAMKVADEYEADLDKKTEENEQLQAALTDYHAVAHQIATTFKQVVRENGIDSRLLNIMAQYDQKHSAVLSPQRNEEADHE